MKNSKIKKTIAAILSVAMVFTMTPSTLYAEEEVSVEESVVVGESEITSGENVTETVQEEDGISENEDTCRLSINRWLYESSASLYYTTALNGEEIEIDDNTSETDIPKGSTVWVKGVSFNNSAIEYTIRDLEGTVSTNAIYPETKLPYEMIHSVNSDINVLLQEKQACRFNVSFDENATAVNEEDFRYYRSNGDEIHKGDTVFSGDSITVSCNASLESDELISVKRNYDYTKKYISAKQKSIIIGLYQNDSTIYIQQEDSHEVTFDFPDEYQGHLKFFRDYERTDELENGDAVAPGETIYVSYDGFSVETAKNIKVSLVAPGSSCFCSMMTGKIDNSECLYMTDEDSKITIKEITQSKKVPVSINALGVQIYTDNTYTKLVGNTMDYYEGDRIYYSISNNSSIQYRYHCQITVGEYGSFNYELGENNCHSSIRPDVNDILRIDVTAEKLYGVTISNNCADEVQFYKNENCTEPFNSGEFYSGDIYAKLQKEIAEDDYIYLDNSYSSDGYLSNESPIQRLYVRNNTTITVEKKSKYSLSYDFAENESIIHLYYDQAHTKQVLSGSKYIPGTQIYAVLSEQADADKDYFIRIQKTGYDSTWGFFVNQKEIPIYLDGKSNISISSAGTQERLQNHIEIEDAYQSYVGLYYNSECTQVIPTNGYISRGHSIYIKQKANIPEADGKALRVRFKQYKYDSESIKNLSSGLKCDYQLYNEDYSLKIESYNKPTVHVTLDDEFQGKIKFYSDSNCSSEIKDGNHVSPETLIYGKLTQIGSGMTIPVHIDGAAAIYDSQVSSLNGAGLNCVNVNSTSNGIKICTIRDTDITLTARNQYHLQISEEDTAADFTMKYEIARPDGDFEILSENDCWVPYGSRLRVMAKGMDEDNVPVISSKRMKYTKKGYRMITDQTALYDEQDSMVVNLEFEAPIHISGVQTAPITINDMVPNSENYISYTYKNGRVLHNGDKLAEGETIAISVNGAPDHTAIHTDYYSEYLDYRDEEEDVDYYARSTGEYYHFYNSEFSSEYMFTVVGGKNVINTEVKTLHKVTITKPEEYGIQARWSVYSDDNEAEYYYEFYSDPDSSDSNDFLVPDGENVYFSCDYGINDRKNALKLTADGSDKALDYIFNDESGAGVKIVEKDWNFTLSPVNVYKINCSRDVLLGGEQLYRIWTDDDESGYTIQEIYAPVGETVMICKNDIPLSERYQVNVYKTEDSATKILENKNSYLTYNYNTVSFTMPDFPITVDASKGDQKKYTVRIKENNFSKGTSASYKKYVSSSNTETLKDGEEVYEDQNIRINTDSIAANKKMLVTIKETGTNEYASGSQQGTLIEGIRSFVFRMMDRPVTIEVTEKDRKGSGNAVAINENISNSTEISYSVENGDLVSKGGTVTLNVLDLKEGNKVHMNVVCPDQNLVASGSGIQNDFSKPYYAKEITTTGKIEFEMPDYPIVINVWEDTIDRNLIDISTATINLDQNEMKYTGNEIKPPYTVILNDLKLIKDTNYTESYTNNINAGTATLTITGKGRYSGTVTKDFTIAKRALDDVDVTISMTDKVIYNYKPQYEPKPVIKIGNYLLAEGNDYILAYANNTAPTDKATVTITGKGNISGTITKTFAISSNKQELKDATIKIKETDIEYTGEEITPEITVICNNETLEESIDYEASYLNNVNAGTATVKISGLGNYNDSAKMDFTINPRKLDSSQFNATVANQKFNKKISKYEPQPIVTYGGKKMVLGVDYTLEYANNTGESNEAKVTITGINNYDGSQVLTFSILKEYIDTAKMKITIGTKDFVYDGDKKEPSVTVKYKGEDLTKGEDYEVSYQDNVNAGTAKIIISGIGEYVGSKTSNFKISPKVISDTGDYSVKDIPDEEYNGMNCPTPTVSDNKTGQILNLQDVNYVYKNNKKVNDKASVIIKGIGNYRGSITKKFKITPLSFDSYEYSIDDCSYTGSKVQPDVIATNLLTGERITLKTGTALKVVFKDNVEIGKATATISPKNKKFFTIKDGDNAKKVITFSIVKCNLEDVVISPIKDQKYNKGKEIKPQITVKLGTAKLKQNKQYKVTYKNNKEKGYGTATITPKDETHFEGSQEIKFVIK